MSLFRLPTASDIFATAFAFAVFSSLAVPFALVTGLFDFDLAQDPVDFLKISMIALITPAILEEVIFRAPVAWLSQNESQKLVPVTIVSLLLFILWHPLNGIFLMTEAYSLFTDWRFLSLAGLLGLFATQLAIKTRSIWPPVIFHWLCVVGWKAFLGGPQFLG